MADDQHDWQLLNDIFYKFGRLDHPLYQPLAHDNYPSQYRLLALESAFRSRTIPMRGCRVTALCLAPHERIETKIDAETAIDIPLDEVTLRNRYGGSEPTEIAVFKRVQADMASVEQWLPENILRADHVVDEPQAAGEEAPDDVEADVTDEGGAHRETRPALASVTDAEIDDFLKGTGCSNMNVAWPLVKAKFSGVTQNRFRTRWNKGYFGGRPGRRVKCVR